MFVVVVFIFFSLLCNAKTVSCVNFIFLALIKNIMKDLEFITKI